MALQCELHQLNTKKKIAKNNSKTVKKVLVSRVYDPSCHPFGHADLWGLFNSLDGVFFTA